MKTPLLLVIAFAETAVMMISGSNGAAASAESIFVKPNDYSTFTKVGAVNADTEIEITFVLPLQNEDELDAFIEDIYDPKSVNYRGYLSSSEFCEKYCPSDVDVAQVKSYLEKNNFKVYEIAANNRLVHAYGTATDVNEAFRADLSNYVDSKTGEEFYAPGNEPVLPVALNVQAILGLENRVLMHHQSIPSKIKASSLDFSPYLTPENISSTYNLTEVSEKGAGQVLGLVEFGTYDMSDIRKYHSTFFGKKVPLSVKNVRVSRKPITGGPNGEVILDIELMHALAPYAKIIVYEAPNTNIGSIAMLNKIGSTNLASVISSSWGACENNVLPVIVSIESTIFMEMAAQGQTVVAATGDNGAFCNKDGVLMIQDPSSQPYVTAVGGTTLESINGPETTWWESNRTIGGAGGVSIFWSIPSWQEPVMISATKGSTTMRNVPDVSLNANPDATPYWVLYEDLWYLLGGTSCAAPLWGAFLGLTNERRGGLKKPRL
jgi:subtilase family serine protease